MVESSLITVEISVDPFKHGGVENVKDGQKAQTWELTADKSDWSPLKMGRGMFVWRSYWGSLLRILSHMFNPFAQMEKWT